MEVSVTIVMPSLNVSEYIRECIESALNQTLKNIEIICVDAGSTDGTRQILSEYANRDNRVHIIDSEKKSYGKQVNMGIETAKGKYIAVLETDDFVHENMYELLYSKAEEENLDYIMADFQAFYEQTNSERVFTEGHVFSPTSTNYNRILSMEDHSKLYETNDITLWRGIYSRGFLNRNRIRLNETAGAAYQDICFMHLVRMNVKRCMYIRDLGYCYRTDRDGSSVNSIRGLQYSKYEYQYLVEHNKIPLAYLKKMYYLMSTSFIGESMNILPRVNYLWSKEDDSCYEWFRTMISDAIQKQHLNSSMGSDSWWNSLNILLTSKEEFATRIKTVHENYQRIEQQLQQSKYGIICGAGAYGKILFEKLSRIIEDEDIVFADNNSQLWGTKLKDIMIYSINDVVKKYPYGQYFIANKMHASEVKQQLLDNNIKEENILIFNPIIDWNLYYKGDCIENNKNCC